MNLARKLNVSTAGLLLVLLLSCYRAAPPMEKGDYWDSPEQSNQTNTDPSTLHPEVRKRKTPYSKTVSGPDPIKTTVSTPAPTPRAPEDYFPAPGAAPTVAPTGAPAPRLLNVAILTKSVECVWCHMNIYGDVGGIDFTAGNGVDNVNIFGKIFGTKTIPAKMQTGARDGYAEFYNNSDLKIFPLTTDSSGATTFPTPKESEIEAKVGGRFRYNSIIVGPVIQKHLYIPTNTHFEIAGDVLIKGDLVIAGTFSGQGTLYARNIFIPANIEAKKHPYPFSENYETALQEARASIARADDSLHLFALGQITIGSIHNGLASIIDQDRAKTGHAPSPYTATAPEDLSKLTAYTQTPPANCTHPHYNPHVNRVDAFLYATDYITWRACGGYQLNGGFVAPIVAISSNWTPASQNITRYDYRFRVGSTGFLALQDYFNSAGSP